MVKLTLKEELKLDRISKKAFKYHLVGKRITETDRNTALRLLQKKNLKAYPVKSKLKKRKK